MSDPTSLVPPPLPSAKPKRGRGIKVFIGVCAGAILLANLIKIANTPTLEVERTGFFHQGNVVNILNTSDKPVTVKSVLFNSRSDCDGPQKRDEITLRTGDSTSFFSMCQIVRAEIRTDQGTQIFSFSGPPD